MIATLVVQDSGLVRSAIEHLLGRQPDLDVRVVESSADAIRSMTREPPRVVVTDAERLFETDLRAAGSRNGARWLARVAGADDVRPIADVLLRGASGLYTDETSEIGLVDAVRHVAAGHGWLAPELVLPLGRDYLPYYRRRRLARERISGLSVNETRLLGLLAEGRTNAAIAGELYLATSTVKDYVQQLLGRLHVTRAEAIALAVRADLSV